MSDLKPPSAFSIPSTDDAIPIYPEQRYKLPAIPTSSSLVKSLPTAPLPNHSLRTSSSCKAVGTQVAPDLQPNIAVSVATQATVEQVTTESQSDNLHSVSELEEYIIKLSSLHQDALERPAVTNPEFQCIWDALAKLETSLQEKDVTIDKLSAAIHRIVPESLENQRVMQSLENEKSRLEHDIDEMADTIRLLEKRMDCQAKVLAIQEKTLTTDASYQKMLEAWRLKVLQMLVEKEMVEATEHRTEMVLKSQIERLEKLCQKHESEIEILSNKNTDLLANLKLKDKHINTITNELSIAKQSEFKYQHLNELIEKANNSLCESISSVSENFEQLFPSYDSVSSKLSEYEDQIFRITESIQLLQSLYAEKEEFYSNKLETLLVEHTKPLQPNPKTSSDCQTDSTWYEIETNTTLLNDRITEHSDKINSLTVEKGLITSQLAEAEAARCELKHQLEELREQLNTKCNDHAAEVVNLQKRESKAAIRAKQVERLLAKKEDEVETLEREVGERWKLEVEQFREQIQGLKNENLSLKQALKRG